jgi:MFS family permease
MTQETEIRPAQSRANFQRGVWNGILFTAADAFSSAVLVLAVFVRQLGGSLTLVGLLPALQSGGFLLPQLLVGGRIQAMRYKLPLYRRAAMVRWITFAVLTLAIFSAAILPADLTLWAVVLCFAIYNLAGGTSTLAFQDVVAKTIPARQRGRFFGQRQFYGGLVVFLLVGPLVRWLLSPESPLPFPYNYGVLFVLALVLVGGGLYVFATINEPATEHPGPRLHFFEGLQRAPAMLRGNANYRWFIVSRLLTRAGQIAEPFYMIYAIEVLRLPASTVGIYLALRALAGALSNLIWGRMSDRQGNRRVLLLSGGLLTLAPLLAFGGHYVVAWLQLGELGLLILIGLLFLVVGVATDGSNIGGVYLMEIVPENERPSYVGFANTTLGLATFLPVLGGWLLVNLGYAGTFLLAFVFACLGVASTLPLRETERSLQARRLKPTAPSS